MQTVGEDNEQAVPSQDWLYTPHSGVADCSLIPCPSIQSLPQVNEIPLLELLSFGLNIVRQSWVENRFLPDLQKTNSYILFPSYCGASAEEYGGIFSFRMPQVNFNF